MSLRFPALIAIVALVSFVTAWCLPGLSATDEPELAAAPSPASMRPRQAVDEPSLWRIRAREAYGPPVPLGGVPASVPGRLMQQACEGVAEGTWQVPSGARQRDLCVCVGRMMDRTPEAEGLAALTDQLFVTRQPPHPNSSEMATALITARIACQRGLFAALRAEG